MGNRRDAFKRRIIELKKEREFVVMDADVGNATRTWDFGKVYPDYFYEMGIAEQDMVGAAAGIASCGIPVIASTFATFITMRAFEVVRTSVAYPRLPVKLVGGYAGLSNGKDGATNQSIEDLALMRMIPNMSVLNTADDVATAKIIDIMLDHEGPVYMRMEFDEVEDIYSTTAEFPIGGMNIVRDGKDITVVACGSALAAACQAAKALEKEGISVQVMDAYCLKPFGEKVFLEAAQKTGRVITLEDHSTIGGLAGAVCECLCKNNVGVRYDCLGIEDVFTESGKTPELRARYGLDAETLMARAKRMMEEA